LNSLNYLHIPCTAAQIAAKSVEGLHDNFAADPDLQSLKIVGPKKAGALLEGSKDFAKEFMLRHHIPTAKFFTVTSGNLNEGVAFLKTMNAPYVLKADGLAAGKGVLIINDFNEANFKLAFNLEYRFPLLGAIKGALFTDAGNIWNALDGVNDPERSFQGISSLQQIAIGSGFGVRYDFTYFVFRLDVGFKTYNPSLENSKRWFRDYNFANSVINIGINYPF